MTGNKRTEVPPNLANVPLEPFSAIRLGHQDAARNKTPFQQLVQFISARAGGNGHLPPGIPGLGAHPAVISATGGRAFLCEKDGSLRPCIDYQGLNPITDMASVWWLSWQVC